MQLNHGMLISIEGIDGCGKSTLADNLTKELSSEGLDVVLTREPGKTELGSCIRTVVQRQTMPVCSEAEYLLFAADRAQHFNEFVIPQLKNNKIIISDRMADSSVVYQGFGRGLDTDMIRTINRWVMHGIQPDLTFYIRVSTQTALTRIRERKKTLSTFEKSSEAFIETLITGFETIFQNNNYVVTLNGHKDIPSLTQEAKQYVIQWIQKKQLIQNKHTQQQPFCG